MIFKATTPTPALKRKEKHTQTPSPHPWLYELIKVTPHAHTSKSRLGRGRNSYRQSHSALAPITLCSKCLRDLFRLVATWHKEFFHEKFTINEYFYAEFEYKSFLKNQ